MKGIFSKDNGGRLQLTVSKEIYERQAVMAAAYKLTDLCTILIRPKGEKEVEVVFEPKYGERAQDLERIASEFCNDILDHQIRLDLERRCGAVRDIIVRHAFSPLENLRELLNEP